MRALRLVRKPILLSSALVMLVIATMAVLAVRTSSQRRQAINERDRAAFLQQIETSVEQPLKILGNEDCPLKIVQATAKEISGPDFTKLTGMTTDLPTVSSVPEVSLVNASGKPITGFVLAVRDPQSDMNRGVVQPKASIPPAGSYRVTRKDFVSPDQLTVTDAKGQPQHKIVQPGLDRDKYWIQFAQRSDLFVFISFVVFDDGTEWEAKKKGELK